MVFPALLYTLDSRRNHQVTTRKWKCRQHEKHLEKMKVVLLGWQLEPLMWGSSLLLSLCLSFLHGLHLCTRCENGYKPGLEKIGFLLWGSIGRCLTYITLVTVCLPIKNVVFLFPSVGKTLVLCLPGMPGYTLAGQAEKLGVDCTVITLNIDAECV